MSRAVRQPVVAGSFYPGDPGSLRDAVRGFLGVESAAANVSRPLGLIVPHAGYVYSGAVAGKGFRFAASHGRPDAVVVLGANHTGLGAELSLPDDAAWRTPLGDVPLAGDLLADLARRGVPVEPAAFRREHSIEVQLPFLQILFGESPIPIVPMTVQFGPIAALLAGARSLGEALTGRSAWVVVSSDFTHYEADDVARSLDDRALDVILAGDAEAFHRLVRTERPSICGAGAIVVLLAVVHALGLRRRERIAYATSGEASGDRTAVVGYAAAAFTEEAA